jgi:hypothetical protein
MWHADRPTDVRRHLAYPMILHTTVLLGSSEYYLIFVTTNVVASRFGMLHGKNLTYKLAGWKLYNGCHSDTRKLRMAASATCWISTTAF